MKVYIERMKIIKRVMTDKYGSSVEALEGSAPGAHIREGAMLNGDKSEEELKKIAEAFI